jgi:hypothetical protein
VDKKGVIPPEDRVVNTAPRQQDTSVRAPLDRDQFKQLLVQWLVTSHVSFAQVENTEFRRFLAFINDTVTYVAPHGA